MFTTYSYREVHVSWWYQWTTHCITVHIMHNCQSLCYSCNEWQHQHCAAHCYSKSQLGISSTNKPQSKWVKCQSRAKKWKYKITLFGKNLVDRKRECTYQVKQWHNTKHYSRYNINEVIVEFKISNDVMRWWITSVLWKHWVSQRLSPIVLNHDFSNNQGFWGKHFTAIPSKLMHILCYHAILVHISRMLQSPMPAIHM